MKKQSRPFDYLYRQLFVNVKGLKFFENVIFYEILTICIHASLRIRTDAYSHYAQTY